LPTPTTRSKWRSEVQDLKEGDVVLIIDHNAPRGQWPLARVLKAIPGVDGRVRVVQLKTPSGICTRPVSQICLLEEA
jgi:hypothetical protein